MAINSKIVYVKTKNNFESLKPTIPENLNPIVFIEDSKEVWVCGTYFNLKYPTLSVFEENSIVNISLDNSTIQLVPTGDGLSIRKGSGNRIIFNSLALSSILTETPLEWIASEKKLIHSLSKVTPDTYGPTAQIENASTFQVPYFSVDKYGHIQVSGTTNIGIRDYVEQKAPSTINQEKSLLISSNVGLGVDTTTTEKATATYNNVTGTLSIPGGLNVATDVDIGGDIEVKGVIIGTLQGSVTGDATPKVHADVSPKFGGASLNLYGHVKLQDVFIGVPEPSSSNDNPNSTTTERGVAASPKLVWDTKVELEQKINNKPGISAISGDVGVMAIDTPNKEIKLKGINGVSVEIIDNEINIKGVQIYGFDSQEIKKTINNELTIGKDFITDDLNEVNIRWLELE